MRHLTRLIFPVVALLAVTSSCKSTDNPLPPTPPAPQPPKLQLTLPASTDEIAPSEYAVLMDFATRNGLEAQFKAKKPSEWDLSALAFDFVKGSDSKYHITKILNGSSGYTSVKKLSLLATETLPELQRIELIAPLLEEVQLRNLPKLAFLSLKGTQSDKKAPLTKLTYEVLPLLDSVILQSFPSLKTANDDKALKLPAQGYDPDKGGIDLLPKIGYIELTDLPAVTELYVDPLYATVSKGVSLSKLSSLSYLLISGAKLSSMTFDGKDYPRLETLTIKKPQAGSATALTLSALPKLHEVLIQSLGGVTTATVSSSPELTKLDIGGGKLSTLSLTELPKLQTLRLADNELKSLDLSTLSTLRTVDLSHNLFASIADMKLPNTITSLAISGNEAITEANLAPYRDLEAFVCFGLKKGKTAQDHNQRGSLAAININGLAKLQMLRVPNNRLSSIFELGYEYPVLETLEIDHNSLSPEAHVKTYLVVGRGKSKKITLTKDTFEGQAPYTVTVRKDGTVDLTGIHKVLISPDSPFGLSGSGDLIGILILESQRFPAFAGQEANTSNARILLGEDPDYGNGLWQIRNKGKYAVRIHLEQLNSLAPLFPKALESASFEIK